MRKGGEVSKYALEREEMETDEREGLTSAAPSSSIAGEGTGQFKSMLCGLMLPWQGTPFLYTSCSAITQLDNT